MPTVIIGMPSDAAFSASSIGSSAPLCCPSLISTMDEMRLESSNATLSACQMFVPSPSATNSGNFVAGSSSSVAMSVSESESTAESSLSFSDLLSVADNTDTVSAVSAKLTTRTLPFSRICWTSSGCFSIALLRSATRVLTPDEISLADKPLSSASRLA